MTYWRVKHVRSGYSLLLDGPRYLVHLRMRTSLTVGFGQAVYSFLDPTSICGTLVWPH